MGLGFAEGGTAAVAAFAAATAAGPQKRLLLRHCQLLLLSLCPHCASFLPAGKALHIYVHWFVKGLSKLCRRCLHTTHLPLGTKPIIGNCNMRSAHYLNIPSKSNNLKAGCLHERCRCTCLPVGSEICVLSNKAAFCMFHKMVWCGLYDKVQCGMM